MYEDVPFWVSVILFAAAITVVLVNRIWFKRPLQRYANRVLLAGILAFLAGISALLLPSLLQQPGDDVQVTGGIVMLATGLFFTIVWFTITTDSLT